MFVLDLITFVKTPQRSMSKRAFKSRNVTCIPATPKSSLELTRDNRAAAFKGDLEKYFKL